MRLAGDFTLRDHGVLGGVGADDHHPAPASVSFSNTAQSLPPGTTYNLDVALSNANFRLAKVYLEGPAISGGGSGSEWREAAIVHATTDTSEAIGHSCRNVGSMYKSYVVTYAKSVGVTNLTHKIFDTVTATSSRYIALMDAQIIGAVLRLVFRNYFGGSATLSVKGQVLLY